MPEEVKGQVLFRSSATRNEDGSCTFVMQSDLLEDFFKKHTVIKGAEGERFDFFPEKFGVRAYRHDRCERLMGDYIGRRAMGWGDVTVSYEYILQFLKAVGLTEGITVILPQPRDHEWGQAYIEAAHNQLRDTVNKIYTRNMMPTEGELTMTVTQRANRLTNEEE